MISVVNGYVCTSPCEVASAKQGRDPLPAGVASRRASSAGTAATMLGGALKDTAASNFVTAADNTQQPQLDRLA
jgi:hypothetical protein